MASILKAVRVGSSGLFGRLKHKSKIILLTLMKYCFCGFFKSSFKAIAEIFYTILSYFYRIIRLNIRI